MGIQAPFLYLPWVGLTPREVYKRLMDIILLHQEGREWEIQEVSLPLTVTGTPMEECLVGEDAVER